MSRWRKKSLSAEDGADNGAALVVSGSIRSPDETDALGVELTVDGSEIALHADGSELGRWDATALEIRQIDATSFEFVAEGDRLIFLPDDPAAFGIIPIARGDDVDAGRGRERKAKRSKSHTDESGASPSPKPAKAKKEPKPAKESRARRTGVWLRTLDMARRYDLLGLDRVPVELELRGGEHQHTWDHRVAATSGAGKHICTLCGRIRR